MPDQLTCKECGLTTEPYLWMQTARNGVDMLRADCPDCDRYIKYCSQYNDPTPRFATSSEGYNTDPTPWLLAWEAVGSPRKPRYER